MKTLPNPYYYLDNFRQVLEWTSQRYGDLLLPAESAWIHTFARLPLASQALLVRLVMRKGTLFRSSKLRYDEIGCPVTAARELVEAGWIDDDPMLQISHLYSLLRKDELLALLPSENAGKGWKKEDLLELLCAAYPHPMRCRQWLPESDELVYALLPEVDALCTRLRLMFFGNPYQDWSEFVLADLGIFQYEKVSFDARSRAFACRADVDSYLHLHQCRIELAEGEDAQLVSERLGPAPMENAWLASRYGKLLFQIGQQFERSRDWDQALTMYQACCYPEARLRKIRVYEQLNKIQAAYALTEEAIHAPYSEHERQQLSRIMPRLRRKLGLAPIARSTLPAIDEWLLTLPSASGSHSVEEQVRQHLGQPEAPAFFVENNLINSLFGLLFWDVIFCPAPGAFFHPFHTGPADLLSADFYSRRKNQFDNYFEQLDSGDYKATILERYQQKFGIQSPFVAWLVLSKELLDIALDCIPAAHLRLWFARILRDMKANRTGFPDLIQFWPDEQRYRMIEVKGPGDRLQDNQIRLLEFAQTHGMPASVCYVEWMAEPA